MNHHDHHNQRSSYSGGVGGGEGEGSQQSIMQPHYHHHHHQHPQGGGGYHLEPQQRSTSSSNLPPPLPILTAINNMVRVVEEETFLQISKGKTFSQSSQKLKCKIKGKYINQIYHCVSYVHDVSMMFIYILHDSYMICIRFVYIMCI